MALELQGKLVQINPEQTGVGKNGNWVKQDMIIETTEQYPKKICITCWGDKTEQIKNLQAGTDLKVSIDIESREFNGKWYTNLKAWKIDVTGNFAPVNNNNSQQQQSSYASPPPKEIPAQPVNDDLPF